MQTTRAARSGPIAALAVAMAMAGVGCTAKSGSPPAPVAAAGAIEPEAVAVIAGTEGPAVDACNADIPSWIPIPQSMIEQKFDEKFSELSKL